MQTCCPWRVVVFPHDSQSVLASVASDGSFRSVVASSVIFCKKYDGHIASEPFIVERTEPAPGAESAGSIHISTSKARLDGYEVRGAVNNSTGTADGGGGGIANPRVSLNALDFTVLRENAVLLAYGGNSGVVRLSMDCTACMLK